jgi:hypothetical protein
LEISKIGIFLYARKAEIKLMTLSNNHFCDLKIKKPAMSRFKEVKDRLPSGDVVAVKQAPKLSILEFRKGLRSTLNLFSACRVFSADGDFSVFTVNQ